MLQTNGEMTRLLLHEVDPASSSGPYFSELFLCHSHRFCNWLLQEQLPLHAVNLKYEPVASTYRKGL
jgi:hypothetical protein